MSDNIEAKLLGELAIVVIRAVGIPFHHYEAAMRKLNAKLWTLVATPI